MSTLEELRACPKPFITPAEAAPLLGVNPAWIRGMAQKHPDQLKFEVLRSGRNTRIHRISLLRYLEGNWQEHYPTKEEE